MIEIGSYWKRKKRMLSFLDIEIVKVIGINANNIIISEGEGDNGASIERYMFLKYYTKLTPLEVELL